MFKLRSARVAVLFVILMHLASAWAQTDACGIRHVRVLELDDHFDETNLDGIVFPPRARSILVLDSPVPGAGTFFLAPPGSVPGEPDTLAQEISDPVNVTLDGRANRLFLYEPDTRELMVIHLGGRLRSPRAIQHFKADEYGVEDPNGIAVDPKTGLLSILDRFGERIVRVDPGPGRKDYDGAAALAEGRISELFLQGSPGPLRGLGFNHRDRNLYVFSPSHRELYEISEDGQLLRVGALASSGPLDARGFVFVRSLDQTDDANRMNLYVASSSGSGGMVTEWTLEPCVPGRAR